MRNLGHGAPGQRVLVALYRVSTPLVNAAYVIHLNGHPLVESGKSASSATTVHSFIHSWAGITSSRVSLTSIDVNDTMGTWQYRKRPYLEAHCTARIKIRLRTPTPTRTTTTTSAITRRLPPCRRRLPSSSTRVHHRGCHTVLGIQEALEKALQHSCRLLLGALPRIKGRRTVHLRRPSPRLPSVAPEPGPSISASALSTITCKDEPKDPTRSAASGAGVSVGVRKILCRSRSAPRVLVVNPWR